ncbi:MAG: DUF123 domain-containing protein [Anaerolineae bacterium]|nr:DUF123 domain-containing protein [Anaerolineae bacterium]
MTASLIILGDSTCETGTYVLRLALAEALELAFGHFQGGTPVALPAGDWVYVGSALSRGPALGRRLARHATRTGNQPPHALRPAILTAFGIPAPRQKTLRWHIDYLLDRSEGNLTHGIAVRSTTRLETPIANLLVEQGQVIVRGLGASDAPGETHLLYWPGGEPAWELLTARLMALVKR